MLQHHQLVGLAEQNSQAEQTNCFEGGLFVHLQLMPLTHSNRVQGKLTQLKTMTSCRKSHSTLGKDTELVCFSSVYFLNVTTRGHLHADRVK